MSSFEAQVHRYKDRIYGFAYHYLHDRAAAEDVTQEVLIRFWEHRDELRPEGTLAWLLRVTRNACIDALRRRSTRRRVMIAPRDGLRSAHSRQRSPEAEAETADFQAHLEDALARIDEPYRSILILREIQDFQYKEISGALDLPMNTVKVYLHRARKKLRKELAEVIDYEPA